MVEPIPDTLFETCWTPTLGKRFVCDDGHDYTYRILQSVGNSKDKVIRLPFK